MERVDEHGTSTEDLEKAAMFDKVTVNDRPVDESKTGGLRNAVKEILFPHDPFRRFKNQPRRRKWVIGLQYAFPILEWLPTYSFRLFKSDIISGITIASLAIPQGISYAKLANLPPVMGLYSSFVPPLIYAILGSSKDLAVGTIASVSILLGSMLSHEVSPTHNPELYVRLAMTATFFAGVFQASLGIFRLGFIIDLLSHATIVGFMAGVATVVSLQQLKGIFGLRHFTAKTDIVSIVHSVSKQADKWRWETIVLGVFFLILLLTARYISKKRPRLFWISAATPLISVIIGSLLVFITHADKHGVEIVGHLKKGLNPVSIGKLASSGKYLKVTVKAGLISGLVSLTEGIAIGRTFSLLKNYNIDGNKEVIAIGIMNIVGSCTTCYVTTGAFSRSAVNFNAGCKTAFSNVVMATAVMITLLFLTFLFYYTPTVVLSSIIISAMLGLIDIHSVYNLWKVDKIDFFVCLGGYLGVVLASVEVGLAIAVSISLLRLLMHIMRPHTAVLGNIPGSSVYRSMDQYPHATRVPGILILRIESPIFFANSTYLKDRILRWVEEEEESLAKLNQHTLRYVVLDMGPVTSIDTSGINTLDELRKKLEQRQLQLVLANPGRQGIEKLHKSKFMDALGQKALFFTVEEAIVGCNTLLHVERVDDINCTTNNNSQTCTTKDEFQEEEELAQ